jgi:hypothetical protein
MRLLGKRVVAFVAIALALAGSFLLWQHGQPRREAVLAVSKLADNLANNRGSELLDAILIPVAVQSRTQTEQQEFITKALADEISPSGVEALKRQAEFGPLNSVFPKEAPEWCSQAGVDANDCVAFKMERAGIRAEVVMLREGQTYRIVRCNNVKQMATKGQHA